MLPPLELALADRAMSKSDELRHGAGSMTIDELGPEMIGLVPDLAKFVPPARTFDKHVYSPWTGSDLHLQLRNAGIDSIVITGGETDVCVRFVLGFIGPLPAPCRPVRT
jgi:nicotinamidase-related amidase